MSKELEALKRIETTFSMNKQDKESVYRGYTNSVYPYYEDFDLVLKALQRLEAIDNSNPSEAIECLNDISYLVLNEIDDLKNKELWKSYFDTIKQALLKAQEEHKALEIIKEKKVNILLLELAENVNEYNERIVPNGRLTEEEFNEVKEVLE